MSQQIAQIVQDAESLAGKERILYYKNKLKLKNPTPDLIHRLSTEISQCYYDLDDFKNAVAWAKKSLEIDSQCTVASWMFIHSLSLLAEKDPYSAESEELIKYCHSFLKRTPESTARDTCLSKKFTKAYLKQCINDCNYFLGELYFLRWRIKNQKEDKKKSLKYINKFLETWTKTSVLQKDRASLILKHLAIDNYFFRDNYNSQIDRLAKSPENYRKAIDLSEELLQGQKSDKYMQHVIYHRMASLAQKFGHFEDSYKYVTKALKLEPDCAISLWIYLVSSLELLEKKKNLSIVPVQKCCEKIIGEGKRILKKDPCGQFDNAQEMQVFINDCKYILGMLYRIKWERNHKDTDRFAAIDYLTAYAKDRKPESEMTKTRAAQTIRKLAKAKSSI